VNENLLDKLPAFIRAPDWRRYLSNNWVVIDFETTNKDKGSPYNKDNSLVLAVGQSQTERRVAWGNEYEVGDWTSWVMSHDFIVAQNGKFELGWLERAGIPLEKILLFDTMIAQYVIDGNRMTKRDLNSLCKLHGVPLKESGVSALIHAGVCPSQIPRHWLEEYCVQDVESTVGVFLSQRTQLERMGLLPHTMTRCLLTPVLVDMERVGMHLDPQRVRTMYNIVSKEYTNAAARLEEFAGGINLNSPKQKAEFIYDRLGFSELTDHRGNPVRTEAGGRSTDKDDIARLTPRSEPQREFLKLFGIWSEANAKYKYLKKFKECVEESGGILHGNLNQTIAATHRLTSTGGKHKVQLQNMKRELKPLFCPRYPGWKSGEGDYAQLEFRTAVWLGNDSVGRHAIASGEDVHSFTASVLHEVPYEEVVSNKNKEPYSEWRQDAKPDTFKPLYGGQSGTPAQQRYYKAFREKYAEITATQERWKAEVLRTKELVLPTGFRFYWPWAKVSRSGYMEFGEQVCNYPVQHLATAEIVPIGVVYTWHYMKAAGMKGFLINTIHDSIISEIPPDEEDLFREILPVTCVDRVVDYMYTMYSIDFDVPLAVDIGINSHWGEKKGWAEKHLQETERK